MVLIKLYIYCANNRHNISSMMSWPASAINVIINSGACPEIYVFIILFMRVQRHISIFYSVSGILTIQCYGNQVHWQYIESSYEISGSKNVYFKRLHSIPYRFNLMILLIKLKIIQRQTFFIDDGEKIKIKGTISSRNHLCSWRTETEICKNMPR